MRMRGVVLILALSAVYAQAQGIQVNVNGQHVSFGSVGPQRIGGRVLVPIRSVFESLGAIVRYDAKRRLIQATKGDRRISLRMGQRLATVGDEEVVLEVPARQIHGRAMVPLRFIGESLGADVQWDSDTKSIEINTEKVRGLTLHQAPNERRVHMVFR